MYESDPDTNVGSDQISALYRLIDKFRYRKLLKILGGEKCEERLYLQHHYHLSEILQ